MQTADISFDFPPVRNMFLADPGYTIVDIDLAGADARVVAWDCAKFGDNYRQSFLRADQTGEKIHKINAEKIFRVPDGKREPYYTKAKKGQHATTYGAKPPTLAARCGMTRRDAIEFQERLFATYPEILEWQRDIEHEVQTKRVIYNKFGYRFPIFDRPEAAVTAAFAWRPQSTVAEVTFRAMRLIDRELPIVEQLLQVHDSLVFQIPTRVLHKTLKRLHELVHSIEIPYEDKLIIPWSVKMGDKSWGEAEDIKWGEVL